MEDLRSTRDGRRNTSARSFAAALRELASREDVDETLQLAVELATQHIAGCDVADIMFIRAGGVSTPVSTDELAIELDQVQESTGEGPCLQAGRDGVTLVTADLSEDDRWPQFGARAAALGIVSAASHPLFLHRNPGDRFGVLNLYGRRRAAFDAAAVERGEIFAAQCATALAGAIAREGLQAALESRDVIGQAKGILMERHRISATQAFDLMRAASQQHNLKLRHVANHVATTGELPG